MSSNEKHSQNNSGMSRRHLLKMLGATGVAVAAGGIAGNLIPGKTAVANSSWEERMEGIINAAEFGVVGDGVADDTAALQSFFNAAADGATLLIPPGTYKTNTGSGFLYTFTNKRVRIEGTPDTTIIVKDQGLKFENCSKVTVANVKIERSTQSPFSSNGVYGLHSEHSNEVYFLKNEVCGFTDCISVSGGSTVRIEHNIIHDASQEPIAVRNNLDNVMIRGNVCYRHLGDAILVKGTKDCYVQENVIHSPIHNGDQTEYDTFTGGIVGPNTPSRGGGITCNNEGGEPGAVNFHIENNKVEDTSYGIGLLGFTGLWIIGNKLHRIHLNVPISADFHTNYNPLEVPNLEMVIANNLIDTMLRETPTTAIFASDNGHAGKFRNCIIANNIIIPRGIHVGIRAKGDILVQGNIVEEAGVAMNLSHGAHATGNYIRNQHESISERSVAIASNCGFIGNHLRNSKGHIGITGSDNVVSNNIIDYTGGWWAVALNGSNVTGNIIAHNRLTTGPSADGRILFSNGADINKNIVYDIVQMSDGNFYELRNQLLLESSDSSKWKITVDNSGAVNTSQVL